MPMAAGPGSCPVQPMASATSSTCVASARWAGSAIRTRPRTRATSRPRGRIRTASCEPRTATPGTTATGAHRTSATWSSTSSTSAPGTGRTVSAASRPSSTCSSASSTWPTSASTRSSRCRSSNTARRAAWATTGPTSSRPRWTTRSPTAPELDRYLDSANRLLVRKGQAPLSREVLAAGVNQLKALIDVCHLYGLAVIFDVVYNHASGDIKGQPESIYFFDRAPATTAPVPPAPIPTTACTSRTRITPGPSSRSGSRRCGSSSSTTRRSSSTSTTSTVSATTR